MENSYQNLHLCLLADHGIESDRTRFSSDHLCSKIDLCWVGRVAQAISCILASALSVVLLHAWFHLVQAMFWCRSEQILVIIAVACAPGFFAPRGYSRKATRCSEIARRLAMGYTLNFGIFIGLVRLQHGLLDLKSYVNVRVRRRFGLIFVYLTNWDDTR